MIEKAQFVYRLVDDHENVLYIGQHRGIHPGARVSRHKDKPWWPEVARWDFEKIRGDLNAAEKDLICFWGAYYNQENLKWRAELEALSTTKLIFDAGEAAGGYHYDHGSIHAGYLKLIRTILWRRDQTVVPGGHWYSQTPDDFNQEWDFVDFPVLSLNGFIRTMGCFTPLGGFKAPHPDCAFEIDYWPGIVEADDEVEWELWLERAIQDRRTISYTGTHNRPRQAQPASPSAA